MRSGAISADHRHVPVISLDDARQRRRRLARLSPQQRSVLTLMSRGHDNRRIATALALSRAAVSSTVSRIYAKLEVGRDHGRHRRVSAVLIALGPRSVEPGELSSKPGSDSSR